MNDDFKEGRNNPILQYPLDVLIFLKSKLDDFTISILKEVTKQNKLHKGLVKSRLKDFEKNRKRYNEAFLTLESQGFIEHRQDGTANPYFLTIRGRQLLAVLQQEKTNSLTTSENPELEYSEEVLLFFSSMLDDFTINIFKETLKSNKNHQGLSKTRIPGYITSRKRYDAAFLTLEKQGFIEKIIDGTKSPYFTTVRGRQLVQVLKQIKMDRKEFTYD